MQIIACARCGDEIEPGELNVLGLCPDCARDEEEADAKAVEEEEEDEEEAA